MKTNEEKNEEKQPIGKDKAIEWENVWIPYDPKEHIEIKDDREDKS